MVDDRDSVGHIDLGRPGASAHAEFERRLRRDAERRRRRFGRLLAPLVAVLAGVGPSTARWRAGGEAEERVGRLLSQGVGSAGLVLHDRSVPRSRANIDHIAVVPSGVWVMAGAPGAAARSTRRSTHAHRRRARPRGPRGRRPGPARARADGHRPGGGDAGGAVLRRCRMVPGRSAPEHRRRGDLLAQGAGEGPGSSGTARARPAGCAGRPDRRRLPTVHRSPGSERPRYPPPPVTTLAGVALGPWHGGGSGWW